MALALSDVRGPSQKEHGTCTKIQLIHVGSMSLPASFL